MKINPSVDWVGHEEPGVTIHLSSKLQTIVDPAIWDTFVANHPAGHLLQTWAWGELKTSFGWQAIRLAVLEGGDILAGAQVLLRPVSPAFSLAYVPKGPTLSWSDTPQVNALLAGLHDLCRSRRSVFLKIEPNAPDDEALCEMLGEYGFAVSQFTVQPPRTVVLDIEPHEEVILAAMKQKTRYNIRLAARKGVTVRLGSTADLLTFHRLMEITGQRDRFGIHSLDYFRAILKLFGRDRVALLMAEVGHEPVAGLILLTHGPIAYYLFGASGNSHRDKMPTYLLQWEAIRWAKAHGCSSYDLWGIPDFDEATLEAGFTAPGDDSVGLWGVYRFKRGFGGRIIRAVGAFDCVYNRPLYWAYQQWMTHRRGGLLA
jgi:lipid II:glycine glycyltransferase (peptidoglycan interpeptide bridge formation enzyme)